MAKDRAKRDVTLAEFPRRRFLTYTGTAVVVAGFGSRIAIARTDFPASVGYLVVDSAKCQGCMSCMMACSLAHHGRENLSLSRIQIVQNPFGRFPHDITISACRQCAKPVCVAVCPTEALFIDAEHGNVRRVDLDRCMACQACVLRCPHNPGKSIWNHEEQVAGKCDLCATAKHLSSPGGPGGMQACVAVCPVNAIEYVTVMPKQEGEDGYEVNLRGDAWARLGYPVD